MSIKRVVARGFSAAVLIAATLHRRHDGKCTRRRDPGRRSAHPRAHRPGAPPRPAVRGGVHGDRHARRLLVHRAHDVQPHEPCRWIRRNRYRGVPRLRRRHRSLRQLLHDVHVHRQVRRNGRGARPMPPSDRRGTRNRGLHGCRWRDQTCTTCRTAAPSTRPPRPLVVTGP